MPDIPEEKKKEIIEALTKVGVNLPCPRCANKQFTLLGGYFINPLQTDYSKLALGGRGVPSIATVCTRCGFISQHALAMLGMLPVDNKAGEAGKAEEEGVK